MYFVGCASVYLLVAISIERYLIFKSSMNKPHISSKYSVIILFVCTFLGLLWPIFPLFGWSYYSLETSYMVINSEFYYIFYYEIVKIFIIIIKTCSVEYQDKSFSVVTYNIAMFAFVYFIPLIIIILSNIKLIFMVSNQIRK